MITFLSRVYFFTAFNYILKNILFNYPFKQF
jgi:hypothetical protein